MTLPPDENRPATTDVATDVARPAGSDAGGVPVPDQDARTWAMVAHLSALVGLLGNGVGFFLGPLAVWAFKKDSHPFVDEQGKEAINFQLTLIIVGAIAVAVMFTIIGIVIALPVLLIVTIVMVVMPIVAGVRANQGEHYRYPLSWRLIK